MTTRVIIVRHGQSSFNAIQKIQGRSDLSVLTEQGHQDALKVGQSLATINIDAFYCSPLQRAKMTAEVIQSQLKNKVAAQTTEQLLEVNLPLWESMTKTEVKQGFPQEYQLWKEQPHLFKINIEAIEYYPILALYKQAEDFWQDILEKHPNETVLIVGHNGINRCLIMAAAGIPTSHYHRIQQSNCSINVLNFAPDKTVQFESINQTAHLGIPLPPPRSAKKGIRLLLVRHGETQWNRDSRFQGVRDIPLNDNGRAQAAKTAEFLKDIPIDFAISSPLQRPKETAEIILKYHQGIDLEYRPQLMEICHGLWEGKLEAEIEADYPGLLKEWKTAPETVQMPEGENLQDVWNRAVLCWDEIVKQYASSNDDGKLLTGLVVAHDAINKVILCYLLGLTPANIWNIKQGNGAVTVIDYLEGENNMPVLQALNITSHLSTGIIDKTAAGAL